MGVLQHKNKTIVFKYTGAQRHLELVENSCFKRNNPPVALNRHTTHNILHSSFNLDSTFITQGGGGLRFIKTEKRKSELK